MKYTTLFSATLFALTSKAVFIATILVVLLKSTAGQATTCGDGGFGQFMDNAIQPYGADEKLAIFSGASIRQIVTETIPHFEQYWLRPAQPGTAIIKPASWVILRLTRMIDPNSDSYDPRLRESFERMSPQVLTKLNQWREPLESYFKEMEPSSSSETGSSNQPAVSSATTETPEVNPDRFEAYVVMIKTFRHALRHYASKSKRIGVHGLANNYVKLIDQCSSVDHLRLRLNERIEEPLRLTRLIQIRAELVTLKEMVNGTAEINWPAVNAQIEKISNYLVNGTFSSEP